MARRKSGAPPAVADKQGSNFTTWRTMEPLDLSEWDRERRTPFPESGMTVDYDLPDFPKSLHTVGTHARRKISIYQAFEGVPLIGKSVKVTN